MPSSVQPMGKKPKKIFEYVGRVTTGHDNVSLAHMKSPGGYISPGQAPEFDEFILVIEGMLRVDTKDESFDVHAGQAIIAHRGEWIQYSTPARDGAEFVSVCVPAFARQLVHRDEEQDEAA